MPKAKPSVAASVKPAKPSVKITDTMLAKAKLMRRRMTLVDGIRIYEPYLPPPGVLPKDVQPIAMDSAITNVAAWGGLGLYNGAIQQGLTFLGYPTLAEMAQRPEYRRISEVIATEMTRKWIKLSGKGDKDKTEKIDQLNDEMKRLDVQGKFRELAMQDGFFGRSHLYIDLGTTDDRDELKTPIGNGRNSVSAAKVGKNDLKRLQVVEAVWCYPANYNANNPLKPDWYRPDSWFAMGTELHSSRLLTFVGRQVPDLLKPAFSFGGLSLTQMAKPYVDNWLRTRQSVSDLVSNFSVSGMKTNMSAASQVGGDDMFKRADFFNAVRDNSGVMMLDKETEEWFNVSTPLSTLDALQAQSQEHMAAICGIPIVKLLGITPAGLNASSEGEIRVFYDWIEASQEQFFWENLHRVLGFIQLSLFGAVDPDITFAFEPLWSMDDVQMATVRKTEAETDQVLIDSGVIRPEESRKRVASDPDTAYAGLDEDDVPELEELGQGEEGEEGGEGPATQAGQKQQGKHNPEAKKPAS